MSKKNSFKVNLPEIGSPIIEIRYQFSTDIESVEKFRNDFEDLVDKHRVKGVI